MKSCHISIHEFTTQVNLNSEEVLSNKACISITDVCQKTVVPNIYWNKSLCLKFYDIDIKKHPQAFNLAMAIKTLEFMLEVFHSDIDELVIHCHAGISRSRALHNFFQYYIIKDQNMIDNPPKFIGNNLVYSLMVQAYTLKFHSSGE